MTLSFWQIITIMSVPSAITGFCFWLLEKKLERRGKEQDKREEARKKNELLLIKSTTAAIALGEATARAVQRIPDTHCNGQMHRALDYATSVKHEQKEFLTQQGVENLYDD